MHPEAEVPVEKPDSSGEFAGSGAVCGHVQWQPNLAGREAAEMDTPPLSDSDSESDECLATDQENGLKQCLAEFKRDLEWVERLDVTLGPVPEVSETQSTPQNKDQKKDYRQAQAAVLAVLPRLHQLQVPTKRPTDYFAEMAKSDQQMQKIRQKLQTKQAAMEKSEKAKQLRALRKYGKKVQTEVLQKRQREKAHMMNAIKKYQKGFSDKLDFLEGDQKPVERSAKAGAKGQPMSKGPNAKRRYKNQKFGFGGKKKGSKWNTRESYDDVSSFRAKVAHGKGSRQPGKKGANKRPGKRTRQKLKSKGR
ncbi:Probable rRNA-processing protein EBP2 [Apodemus speciosus]|uniref:Probable rRNA-processing protein EBP2 n=1 Tax=Apodemus speciosus TaxID=105296 RepID=A0ABQ0EP36_APOSI